jgi:DNA repair protein RadC
VAHNHPSGDPEPSAEDFAVTAQLMEAGHLLGIPVRDHVVLGESGFVSLAERGQRVAVI